MKIGLFFGSFNPIHIGHLIIANHMVEFSDLDTLWFVVTPHSPFKEKKSLLPDIHRYRMVQEATEDYPKMKPSKIEWDLPQPNYTINTLAYLGEAYPEHSFNLIMGEDNLRSFHKWKNYEVILENYQIYVYPRIDNSKKPASPLLGHPKIKTVNAPIIQISSTAIRRMIPEGKNIRPLLPEKVWKYLDEMNFYKN